MRTEAAAPTQLWRAEPLQEAGRFKFARWLLACALLLTPHPARAQEGAPLDPFAGDEDSESEAAAPQSEVPASNDSPTASASRGVATAAPPESSPTDSPPAEARGELSAEGTITLGRYLDALAQQRLIAPETGDAERLRELVRMGEAHFFAQRYDLAALLLYEVVESPRFADFSSLDEFAGAELMIASSLAQLGSLRSAARYLERILARGTEEPYFGPAYRRFVDVALQSGDTEAYVAILQGLDPESLPEDADNELRYLKARHAYDSGQFEEAEALLAEVTRRSRFFANSQYLRGVIAAQAGHLDTAEEHFCSIATTGDQERFTFYVDDRFFAVKDLAWLGLGRVAHEGGRSDDAFYYYFQVPNDSERVAAALFEAAFAMYEGEDFDTSVDLLDQLEARFPASPFVDEAMLLRGYVHLGRCEFEEANQLFVAYQERFGPLVEQIDAIVSSPTRQAGLYDVLLAEERLLERRAETDSDGEDADAAEPTTTLQGLLLALLRVDPTFYELHAKVRTLDAEAARAGRLAADLRGLAARLGSTDRPASAAARAQYQSETDELRQQLQTAREVMAGMAGQLDALRSGGATSEQLAPLEAEMRTFAGRVDELATQLRAAIAATANLDDFNEDPGEHASVTALLREDARSTRRLPARVTELRGRLTSAANEAALRSLRQLRERLAGSLRRARIGRIDAVMGSKRRIEIQIESLAAGRFPPELVDPLRVQGLLRDDEEYWPFEGELWLDEFQEADPVEPADDGETDGDHDASAADDGNDDAEAEP